MLSRTRKRTAVRASAEVVIFVVGVIFVIVVEVAFAVGVFVGVEVAFAVEVAFEVGADEDGSFEFEGHIMAKQAHCLALV